MSLNKTSYFSLPVQEGRWRERRRGSVETVDRKKNAESNGETQKERRRARKSKRRGEKWMYRERKRQCEKEREGAGMAYQGEGEFLVWKWFQPPTKLVLPPQHLLYNEVASCRDSHALINLCPSCQTHELASSGRSHSQARLHNLNHFFFIIFFFIWCDVEG